MANNDHDLTTMYEEAVGLRQRGQPRQADALALRLLRRLRRADENTCLDQSLVWQLRARLAMDLGAIQTAGRRFRLALSKIPRRLPLDASQGIVLRIDALSGLAEVLSIQGHYGKARNALERAVRLADQRLYPDSEDFPWLLSQLGMACKFTGCFRRAEELYNEALRWLSLVRGPDDPSLANLYHNLGGLEHARGRPALGLGPARRAVQLRTSRWGPDHPLVAADEAALASILEAVGQTEEAEQLFRHAIAIFTRVYGAEHRELAVNYHNLAALLYQRRQYVDAERLYRQALTMRERLLGKPHPEVAMTLNNLAALCAETGRPVEAEALYQRAFRILRHLPARHPLRRTCQWNLQMSLKRSSRGARRKQHSAA